VDRGFCSVEVFIFLCCLKLSYPDKVKMLRGNHESRGMTEHFSFRNEVYDKLGSEDVYEKFMECFDMLPIAAEVFGDKSGNYLAMHGGISPEIRSKKDIDAIDRKDEPAMSGPFCDLLWSDPLEDRHARKKTFTNNAERQCSYYYGLEPVKRVLSTGGYNSILRAHQMKIDGYDAHRWGGANAWPSVVTIFSAPNYENAGNKGAVLVLEGGKFNIKQYQEVSNKPYHLPRLDSTAPELDVLAWSMPFLMSKINDMLMHLTTKGDKSITQDAEKTKVKTLLAEQAELFEKRQAELA